MVGRPQFNDLLPPSKKTFGGADILFKNADPDVCEVIAFHCQQEVKKCLDIARKAVKE